MPSLSAALAATILFFSAFVNNAKAETATVNLNLPKKVSFYNKITPEAVEKFIAEHSNEAIQTLVIASQGGDGPAGITLGNWVRKNRMDIEVDVICNSACSNFVFPAGNKKTIRPGALVLWHGSIEQKDMRDLHLRYQKLLQTNYLSPGSISPEERAFLDKNKKLYEFILNFRDQQARFYDELQVDEYITRLGQEPVNFGVDAWTTTVKVMEKFGITNVDAPANYGTPAYIKEIRQVGFFCKGGKCLSFDLDEMGQARRLEP